MRIEQSTFSDSLAAPPVKENLFDEVMGRTRTNDHQNDSTEQSVLTAQEREIASTAINGLRAGDLGQVRETLANLASRDETTRERVFQEITRQVQSLGTDIGVQFNVVPQLFGNPEIRMRLVTHDSDRGLDPPRRDGIIISSHGSHQGAHAGLSGIFVEIPAQEAMDRLRPFLNSVDQDRQLRVPPERLRAEIDRLFALNLGAGFRDEVRQLLENPQRCVHRLGISRAQLVQELNARFRGSDGIAECGIETQTLLDGRVEYLLCRYSVGSIRDRVIGPSITTQEAQLPFQRR